MTSLPIARSTGAIAAAVAFEREACDDAAVTRLTPPVPAAAPRTAF